MKIQTAASLGIALFLVVAMLKPSVFHHASMLVMKQEARTLSDYMDQECPPGSSMQCRDQAFDRWMDQQRTRLWR